LIARSLSLLLAASGSLHYHFEFLGFLVLAAFGCNRTLIGLADFSFLGAIMAEEKRGLNDGCDG
jgi:hypothetical protein